MINTVQKLCEGGNWTELIEIIEVNKLKILNDESLAKKILLCVSSYAGSYDVLKLLINFGINVNATDNSGDSALFSIILAGNSIGLTSYKEMVLLLKSGADPNKVGIAGYRPIHWAIEHGRYIHAKILFKNGGNPKLETIDQETAFKLLIDKQSKKAMELLYFFIDGLEYEPKTVNSSSNS